MTFGILLAALADGATSFKETLFALILKTASLGLQEFRSERAIELSAKATP